MQKRICQAGIVLGLMVICFLGGQVVRLKKEPILNLGLPGGGGAGFCCFHADGSGVWKVGQIATDGTVVTASNMSGLCSSGRLPIRKSC